MKQIKKNKADNLKDASALQHNRMIIRKHEIEVLDPFGAIQIRLSKISPEMLVAQ